MSTIDSPLLLRSLLGRKRWGVPERYGPDGWVLMCRQEPGSIIVSRSDLPGERAEWVHASVAYSERMPTYDDLTLLHRAVYDDGWAYQVFAPEEHHVNIHAHALHLFGRDDGAPALPLFARGGSI